MAQKAVQKNSMKMKLVTKIAGPQAAQLIKYLLDDSNRLIEWRDVSCPGLPLVEVWAEDVPNEYVETVEHGKED